MTSYTQAKCFHLGLSCYKADHFNFPSTLCPIFPGKVIQYATTPFLQPTPWYNSHFAENVHFPFSNSLSNLQNLGTFQLSCVSQPSDSIVRQLR